MDIVQKLYPNFSFEETAFQAFMRGVELKPAKRKKRAGQLIELTDLTSLNATDNTHKIDLLVQKVDELKKAGYQIPAICIYPALLKHAVQQLDLSTHHVAVVAGGFPHGQVPLSVKMKEVEYCINEGATEIDLVINRGRLLEFDVDYMHKEVRAIRQICEKRAYLKVILENSDLVETDHIYLASRIALHAGAQMIKTSTGKAAHGAQPKHAWVMLQALRDHHNEEGKLHGIKLAGGIRSLEDAHVYFKMAREFFGKGYLNPATFRIGASSLMNELATIVKE